jgi:hypothetical protein
MHKVFNPVYHINLMEVRQKCYIVNLHYLPKCLFKINSHWQILLMKILEESHYDYACHFNLGHTPLLEMILFVLPRQGKG